MPKLKTRSSITKRFRVTKNGKIMRRRSFTSHLKVNKSKKRRKNLKRAVLVKGFYARKLRRALGIRKK